MVYISRILEPVEVFLFRDNDKKQYVVNTPSNNETNAANYIVAVKNKQEGVFISNAINAYADTLYTVDFELVPVAVRKARNTYIVERFGDKYAKTNAIGKYQNQEFADKIVSSIADYIEYLKTFSGHTMEELKYRIAAEYWENRCEELQLELGYQLGRY